MLVLAAGAVCLASMSLLPIVLLETSSAGTAVDATSASSNSASSPHDLVAQQQQQHYTKNNVEKQYSNADTRTTKDGRTLLDIPVSQLTSDVGWQDKPVARGVAGRPLDQTPAVVGSKRGHITCDDDDDNNSLNLDSLAYWNTDSPRDAQFTSPFRATTNQQNTTTKYLTFSTDRGGWNNVRMSLEILFVLAAATGRTLVLPPKEPLYLMHHDRANRYRGFADFFPIHTAAFQKRVPVITFEEFLQQEHNNNNNNLPIPDDIKDHVLEAADHCDKRDKSSASCKYVFEYLERVGTSPELSAQHTCLIMDEHVYQTAQDPDPATQEWIHTVCGDKRDVVYWTAEAYDAPTVLHFKASEKKYRLLTHYYGMIHFTDPAIDHYYKRFVRDYLHYHDAIYCAAGKIVKAVQAEGIARGFAVDPNGAGAYSALHVRRGDLQYKRVKIPAQEWYDNTKEVWQTNEILYVATDERDKTFFDDLAAHHDLRFLDDYWDMAGLGDLDPNYMGMIDTIVASRGRAFAGTWFSTFSGYINRLRGYHGMSMMDSWYSFLPKKTAVHEWREVADFAYAFEWPDGWIGIDADVWPSRDKF